MAKFVVYADAGDKYRWKLVASNGQTTASSGESFSSKSSAKKARRRRQGKRRQRAHRRRVARVRGATRG